MRNILWQRDAQMARRQPFCPKSHGTPRVDDQRVLVRHSTNQSQGLRWRDAPKASGPAKTLYNRWKRWGDKGGFAQVADGLARDQRGRLIGRTKGGMNTRLHAITDAAALLGPQHQAEWRRADRDVDTE